MNKWDKANHAKYNQYEPDKIKCPLCTLPAYYRKLASHTTQRHQTDARELKRIMGLDNKKGIVHPETRAILRAHALKNKSKVIDQNLLRNGKQSRFKPNHKINYKRSPQTMARLKQQSFIKKSQSNATSTA